MKHQKKFTTLAMSKKIFHAPLTLTSRAEAALVNSWALSSKIAFKLNELKGTVVEKAIKVGGKSDLQGPLGVKINKYLLLHFHTH